MDLRHSSIIIFLFVLQKSQPDFCYKNYPQNIKNKKYNNFDFDFSSLRTVA